jgi:hypothetical protein
LTVVALAPQVAPVTDVGSTLAPAAADAAALGTEAAELAADGVVLAAGLQAAAPRTIDKITTDHRNRP